VISTNPFVVVRDGVSPDRLKGAVLAIGNFDGVHRGHRAVIAAAMSRARTLGVRAGALTFEPHPSRVLRPDLGLFRLTDERSKLRLLAGTGLDGAAVLTFNAALAERSASDFIADVLIGRFAVSGVAIGFDFHFGKNRGGSPAFLTAEGQKHGFSVDVVAPLEDEGRPVSSGSIRKALAEGHVVQAAELLGYPWFASGTVIHGEKRGRALGYPTANIALDPACGLKHGIYAVRVAAGDKRFGGVASFGRRPMFDNGAPLLEVFLFDFSGDLYGASLDVAFIGWIRREMRFESVDDLVRRMDEDSNLAKAALARAGDAFPPFGIQEP
jgi:riboflavin kinase/FMN adenylyltransferase